MVFIFAFAAHVVPFKIFKMFNNSSKLAAAASLKEDLEQKQNVLNGYQAKIQKINQEVEQASSLGSNLKTTANLYANLNKIIPKDIRLTSFGIEEKTNILFSGVAKNDQAVVNMMNNFSENDVVNDSKIEAMVEFSEKDRIDLYTIEGQPAPKIEEIPNENITKKFNSSLSLKPVDDEFFDDEAVVLELTKESKKK